MQHTNRNENEYYDYEKLAYDVSSSMPCGHIHSFNELYYLSAGQRRYFVNGEIYLLNAGDVIYIPKNLIHHTTSVSAAPHERHLLCFSDCFTPVCDERLSTTYFVSLSQNQREQLLTLFNKINAELENKDAFSESLLKAYLAEIFALLLRRTTSEASVTTADTQPESIIEAAAKYIATHLSEKISLSAVAAGFHLSQSYFSRMFKKNTGFGFNEYITHLRLQHAAKLLQDTKLSVAEIAYRCGFSDGNYFSSVFKKHIGIPPKKYRTS